MFMFRLNISKFLPSVLFVFVLIFQKVSPYDVGEPFFRFELFYANKIDDD